MAYATAAEYASATHQEVPTGDQLQTLEDRLQGASDRLDDLTVAAVYPVDRFGMPTTAAVADAFRAATIAQARWQSEHGDALPGEQGAMQLGTLQLPATSAADAKYSPEAVAILRRAGLLSTAVVSAGWGYDLGWED